MKNSNSSTNLEIIKILTSIIEKYPEWRFHQILWNCGIISRDYNDNDELEIEDKFFESSETTLKSLQDYMLKLG